MRPKYTKFLIWFFWVSGIGVALFFSALLIFTLTTFMERLQLQHLEKSDQAFMKQMQDKLESTIKNSDSRNCQEIASDIEAAMQDFISSLELHYSDDIRVLNKDGTVVYSLDKNLIGKPERNKNLLQGLQGETYRSLERTQGVYLYYNSFPLRCEKEVVGAVSMVQNLKPFYNQLQLNRMTMWREIVIIMALLFSMLGIILFLANRELRYMRREQEKNKRLLALGNLAAGVAHEIKNPLNTISLTIQLLDKMARRESVSREELAEELHQSLPMIAREIDRQKEIIDNFISYVRPEHLDMQKADIKKTLQESVDLFAAESAEKGISISLNAPEELFINLDSAKMHRVFVNIIKNAIEAMPDGGKLEIRTQKKRKILEIIFKDTGQGIVSDDQIHIFEPYFTTKKDGLGLGLSLIHKTIENHGGYILVSSQSGAGTQFTIGLPLREE